MWSGGLQPSNQTSGNFKLLARSKEEEEAFDYTKFRTEAKKTGVVGSIAHMVKGALGAGILSGHVGYMKAGVGSAIPLHFFFGIYMCYCLHVLVQCAQTMYKRTRVPSMSYADLGEASLACFPKPGLARFSYCFRIIIDILIVIDLFGSCATYQIIIGKTIKQLVENVLETSVEGRYGHPNLRVYMACMIIPLILICLIRHLKWLAPFSLAANAVIVVAIATAIYFAVKRNPGFENLVGFTTFYNQFEFVGMSVFSMSCAGVVIPIENNMTNPRKFPVALVIGMGSIIICTASVSFFGYVAYLEESQSPITINFPLVTFPKILKGLIAIMIYVTHALNFWVPFNICFYYIKKKISEEKLIMWEYIFRAFFVVIISLVGIIFPNIDNLIGFIGTLCLSNMAFIWPNIIAIFVVWERPGLGTSNWRLWWHLLLLLIGTFILVCGTYVNGIELFRPLFT